MRYTDITLEGKTYYVYVPETEDEYKTGLSKHKSLDEDEGMLFCYDSPQRLLTYTMRDTILDLDIIFIDEEGVVISVHRAKGNSSKPIQERYAQFVLELPMGSGVKPGFEMDELDEDFTEEEKDFAKQNKMLVLDENGDVQMKLEGGERIVSRIETRKLIKQALKAYRLDSDEEYIKLGKLVFKILKKQDSREPEYVDKP